MAHVLVVGGTGMLKEVSLFLAKNDNTVSVIARNRQRLEKLKQEAGELKGRINPIQVDYGDTDHLAKALIDATTNFGPIIMVVNWMDAEHKEASDIIARMVNFHSPICRFFQVLNLDDGQYQNNVRFFNNPYGDMHRVLYRTITLGFQVEDGGLTRLLSPQEVCAGIIDAVRNDRRNHVIGTTEATRLRPQSA